jgi:hypothetical protein
MAIQKVVPPADTTGDHIAALFKLGKVRKKAYYKNTETGELYYDIRGGIAFPAQAPGGIIIIGILKDEHGEPGMVVWMRWNRKTLSISWKRLSASVANGVTPRAMTCSKSFGAMVCVLRPRWPTSTSAWPE